MVEAQKEKPKKELECMVPKLAGAETQAYLIRMRGCKAGGSEYILEFRSPKAYESYGDTENERQANFYKFISSNGTLRGLAVVARAAKAYRISGATGRPEEAEKVELMKEMARKNGTFSPVFYDQRKEKKATG